MLEKLKSRARALKRETYALYLAFRNPRTPWYAKGLIFFVLAHTFSPIDLIPDFIPVLGYLDDLIITPGGIWLAVRMIPPEVLAEAREAVSQGQGPPAVLGRIGAAVIILVWLAILIWILYVLRLF